VYGPFFFTEATITSYNAAGHARPTAHLREGFHSHLLFQQDGALLYFCLDVRGFLDKQLSMATNIPIPLSTRLLLLGFCKR
jgi:hypothetical protein